MHQVLIFCNVNGIVLNNLSSSSSSSSSSLSYSSDGISNFIIIMTGKFPRNKSSFTTTGYDLGSFTEEDDNLLLVHPNLPIVTSQTLGVPTLLSRMLEAEELDFSFGQSDSLTHRLNVLLQEYVDGFAVPKELVQNADDAGATCIKFLYDERQNQDCRTCLIDEGMRECQGPALWVYNNAVFTDEDFDNITKLSGATKERQTEKIGRFGLGFNAVYNITDVPSFVSRENVVIFDPHTTHLGKSIKNKSKPGIKIDLKKHRRKLRRLVNQFKPYNDIFGCDLRPESNQDVYNGTLFRLPLRTKAQAVKSEICQRHYDDSEVKALLMLLIQRAETLLLFAQNVVEIGVYHLPAHGRTPSDANLVFAIHKRCSQILRELLPAVPLSSAAAGKLEAEKLNAVKQSGTLRAASRVLADIRSGVDPASIVTPNAATIFSLEQKLTDPGSRLLRFKYFQKSRPWLVTAFMGIGDSLQMAVTEDSLIPIGGTAVPLEIDPASDCYMPAAILDPDRCPCGTVFSYLPVPLTSGLPVHINGTFAITSNRRHLVEYSEEDKFDARAIWNETLLKDAVSEAYLSMLKQLVIITPQPLYAFDMLWPRPQFTQNNCLALLTSFYGRLADKEESSPALFSDGMKWVSVYHTYFLSGNLAQSGLIQDALIVFRVCCEELPSIIVDIPDFMREGFQLAGKLDVITRNTHDTGRFFSEIFLPNVSTSPANSRDKLVIYALTTDLDPDTQLFRALQQNSCIPVSPDGCQLRKPEDLIDPESSLARLFAPDDGRFPHSTYRTPDILRSLRELGMATSYITWSELLERAESILDLDMENSRKRITALLDSIETKIESDTSGSDEMTEYKAKFQSATFLPVMRQPNNFPLQWKGEEFGPNSLVASATAYSAEYKHIAGCTEFIIDESVFPHVSDKCSDEEAREVISERLRTCPFLLSHNRFLAANQVAFEFSHICSPYLFSLPELYKRNYGDLLAAIGIRQCFETKDFVLALQGMHDAYNANVLNKDSLKLALHLVNLLNDSMQDLNQTLTNIVDEYGTIYIPDAAGILRASSELCFNEPDCNWVPTAGYVNYSHPHIPFAISKQLGVNTKRQEVLRKHSRGIPFGQRERLPVRLKRILSSYPCDKEILKELLQNADDAGATEIQFILDKRQHGTERVFDDSWKPLQGPALCVYNNKPFTDADLTGIQRLGEGSKGTDPNKTGQYGVGFNCVYHLTDTPSFLTSVRNAGQSLCIFDPLAKYVPGATTEEPGRRYDDVTELRNIFSDVFPCYLENHCDLSEGTMFRFPLRTEEMAAESEISDQAISVDTINGLFSKFRQEIFDCLLFLNNVNTITLTEIDKRRDQLVNTYTVYVEMSEENRQMRREFSSYLALTSERIKKGFVTVSQIETKSVAYQITIKDNAGYYERWLITQKIGVNESSDVPQTLNDVYSRQELALLPRGGVAALLDASDLETARRAKKAFCFLPLPLKTDLPVQINGHFALDHESRRNLWQDDDTSTKSEWNFMLLRKVIAPAYVNLLRRLPGHLDGNMVALNLSVTDAVGSDVPAVDAFVEKLPRFTNRSPYWLSLVEGVYQHIHISHAAVLPVVRSTTSFYSLTRSSLSDSLPDATDQVEIEWLSTTGEGTAKPYFDNLDESFPEEEEKETSFSRSFLSRKKLTSTPKRIGRRDVLRKVLLSSGFKLLKLPLEVYNNFLRSDVPVECISPVTVTCFYRGYGSEEATCSIGTLPCAVEGTPFRNVSSLNTLLEYCVGGDETFFSNINGLPLLLCQDGQIRQFTEDDPVYLSPYHKLLPSLTAMFVHSTLVRTVFKNVDVDACPVFLRFDIPSFGSLLANEIPGGAYKTEDRHVLWAGDRETLPSPRWIALLWMFLRDEYERLLPLQGDEPNKETLVVDILRPVRKWSLLPACTVSTNQQPVRSQHYLSTELDIEEQYLVPVGIATTAIDYSNASIMSYPVRECLRKLSVPEVNTALLDDSADLDTTEDLNANTKTSTFVNLLVATMEKPKHVLHCLHYVAEHTWNRGNVHVEDCLIILKYFSDSVEAWKGDEEAVRMLRDLPLYFTVHGDITSLGAKEAYVLPSDIPHADMDAWEQQKGIVFLRSNPALTELYDVLRCAFLLVTEVYSRFIFQNFEYLSRAARVTHLQFIRDHQLPQLRAEEREIFTGHLRALAFLEGEEGRLRQAFHFHDPYHPVYKVMLEGQSSVFPPAPFTEFKWLPFLKTIGLQHELAADRFVEFAELVAKEAEEGPPTDSTFNKARCLVAHVFARENVTCEELLTRVAAIRFIPPAKPSRTLRKLCPAHRRNDDDDRSELESTSSSDDYSYTYISFKEGISESHEELVWTSSFLLPDWANPYKLSENDVKFKIETDAGQYVTFESYQKEIAEQLGVSPEPPVDLVVQHARHVCSAKSPRGADHDDFHAYMKLNVMKRVYKYLQGKAEESDVVRNQMKDTRCIAVDLGQTFVKPKQVVMNLYEEDQIIPYLYKAPIELGEFKSLFLHLGATLNVTADQYALVLESIYATTGGAKLHPNEMTTAFKAVHELFTLLEKHPDEPLNTDVLFLPSTSGRLVQSTLLVFNDEPSYTDRIRKFDKPFLVDLTECKLKARNFEDLIHLLPQQLRPIMLTTLVKEVLDSSTGQVYDFGITEKLRHQLNSRAFSNGVIRLIRHEHRRSGHKVKKAVTEKIQEDLTKVNVIAIDRVITYLTYHGAKIEGSSSESDCFADKILQQQQEGDAEEGNVWHIYLTNSVSMSEELLVNVADVINRIAGGLIANSVHYLQPMLSCPVHTVSRVLDRLKVRPDHSIDTRTPTLPTPGSFIPIEDHHLLREDFVEFSQGEYIGLELDDDESGFQTFIYAIVLNKLVEETTDEHGKSALTQKYEICVGDDHKTVAALATDMYKFHRIERFVRSSSASDRSFYLSSSADGQGHRPSFYEQSSIFEPATPAGEEEVFEYVDGKDERREIGDDRPNEKTARRRRREENSEKQRPGYGIDEDEFVRPLKAHGRFQYKRRPRMWHNDQEEENEQEEGREDYDTREEEEEAFTKNGFSDPSKHPAFDSGETEGYARYTKKRNIFENQEEQMPTTDQQSTELMASTDIPSGNVRLHTLYEQLQEEEAEEKPTKLLDEISDTLEEAWQLSENQRKKVIKRLLLKWHPDKNIGQEDLATAVTQHIQAEIERLELGLPRPQMAEDFANNYDFDARNPFSGSESFKRNFYNAYKYFYEQMNQRAKEHKEQRERYKENFSREYSAGENGYNFDVPPSFSSSNPQPAQAKRFLKQAQEDLRAADNDYDVKEPAYEWVCFKAHQASEKALKAAQFSVDAVASFSHDLASLVATIEDMELRRLALKLQRIVGDSNKLYNPDPVDFVVIPHEEYSKEKACDAIMCAADILERVKEFVESRGD
ncbi:hypothetical protein LSH36_291g08049 [Paralvinella palmiformis]|uniref:HEPN domain-containing protein n=1 Tax=Paralvinella palmiformis TaxID=53620 RepID=A0AAD9JIG7_9ANNE|nr:hypothetical protein LSH36_291g08049 [Paralvinella palmiformis]